MTVEIYAALILLVLFTVSWFVLYKYQKKEKLKQPAADEIQTSTNENETVHDDSIEIPQSQIEPVHTIAEEIPQLPRQVYHDDQSQFLFSEFVNTWLERSAFHNNNIQNGQAGELLTYSFQTGNDSSQIAIICRWKPGLIKGRMEWAKSPQLVAYREYQNAFNIPVFVVVGVGGSPGAPASLSIVPLKKVRSNVLSQPQMDAHITNPLETFSLQQTSEPTVPTHFA